MASQYGRYTPLTPRRLEQNRNSAISSPRTRQPAGTNTGIANQMRSAVRAQQNVPTPTAPGGHRQVPFGGRTTGKGLMSATGSGRSPVSENENRNPYTRGVKEPINPAGPTGTPVDDTYQNQLGEMNRIKNRGGYGMPIPRGNMQSSPPQGIYKRPQNAMRY